VNAWRLRLQAALQRATAFLRHDLWAIDPQQLPQPQRMLFRFLRTAHLALRGIRHDNLPLHAAALTLGTLVSIVPILAVTFSMFKGLGAGDEDVQRMVTDWMVDMPLEFQDFIYQMLDQYTQVNVAAMGGIFLAIVLYIVIKMLAGIEHAFNRIWYIEESRNLLRKISNYISVLVIVPILVVAASAAGALVQGFLAEELQSLAWIYRNLLRLTPLLAAWLAFSFLYLFVPNTRVQAGPGLLAGFIGSLLWLSWQRIYIELQLGVSNYNAIYGTFASVPIFLAWLYVSWMIILLGAELAYALQNAETYTLENSEREASVETRLLVALGLVQHASRSLETGDAPLDINAYARRQTVSIRLVNQVVRSLQRAGLLGALAEQPGCYTLLRAPEKLTVHDVVTVILRDGAAPDELGLEPGDPTLQRVLDQLHTDLGRTTATLHASDLTESQP
jgi:membrane protein